MPVVNFKIGFGFELTFNPQGRAPDSLFHKSSGPTTIPFHGALVDEHVPCGYSAV